MKTNRIFRFMPLFFASVFLLILIPVHAQETQTPETVEMMPYTDETFGISGVVPKDWTKVSPGVYARKASAADATSLIQQAAPVSLEQIKALLKGQLGLKEFPAKADTRTLGSLTWELYSVPEVSGPGFKGAAQIALAESSGKTLIVMLLTSQEEAAELKESVFMPVVKALTLPSASAANSTAEATEALAPDEQEVTFTSGKDTIYGTLLIPGGNNSGTANSSGKIPAAILISGSGPTDRDGNSKLLPGKIDSHKIMARILADQGVATLRYDKLGTGKTGLASYTQQPQDLDFDVYVNEAHDALKYIKSRPEIDSSRIMILGHSEGSLIAMVVATDTTNNVKALALVNGISKPYLQTVHDQYEAQITAAVKAGSMTKDQGDTIMKAIDTISKSLITNGALPPASEIPNELTMLFNPGTAKFLASVAKYDPAKIAQSLPKTMPVLVTCGEKDVQVLCSDVQLVLAGFKQAGNTSVTFVELKDVNHVFKEAQGGAPTNYTDPKQPFSSQMKQSLTDFVKTALQ